jgi:hypothetical protein
MRPIDLRDAPICAILQHGSRRRQRLARQQRLAKDTTMKARPLIAATAASLTLTAFSVAVAASTTATASSPAGSAAADAVSVKDFDVFVDLQTGFAFVKTPDRWTFVRKLDAAQLKNLPPSTLTALAVNPADGGQLGARYAEASPVKQNVEI